MSRAQAKCTWAVVSLVAIWALASDGGVKPRTPKPAATDQKTTKPAPPTAVQPARTDSPKTAVNPPATPAVLENPATFTRDMTLGRAIDILRHCVNPPINIVVLWRNVEEKAGITPETPIGLDGVAGLRVRQYLDLLLRSVSAGGSAELGFCLDGGVVLVAAKDSLPKPKYETRVYDISDLVAPPSYGIMMLPIIPPSPRSYSNYMSGTQNNNGYTSGNSTGTNNYSPSYSQQPNRAQTGTPGRTVLGS